LRKIRTAVLKVGGLRASMKMIRLCAPLPMTVQV